MADRYSSEDHRARRWRDEQDDAHERWEGREESRFANRSSRGSAYGYDHAPSRPDDYGAGRDVTGYEPRWDRSSSRYAEALSDRYHRDDQGRGWRAERDQGRYDTRRWDQQRREAEAPEAARWRDRYEASRFTSNDYEPTRSGLDPYVSSYGRSAASRPAYGSRPAPQYAYGDPDRSWWDHAKDRVAGAFGDDEARLRADHDSYRGYEPERGRYYGHGPKGYARSDDRVREDVSDRLSDDSWLDASSIEVGVSGADVTLSGTVSSRSDKRRAEDLAESVSGVKNVQNNLRVQTASAYGETGVPTTTRAAGSTTGKVS